MRYSTNPASSYIASAPTLVLEAPKTRGATPAPKVEDDFDRALALFLRLVLYSYCLVLILAAVGYVLFVFFAIGVGLLLHYASLSP